jgi:hypothetical protein
MAGQDYPKRLEAGATQNVNIAGDYVFCKFADRPFTVIMDGSRVTMEAGDKYRNSGGFTEFEIENTDKVNPIAIVLTIGQGDYNRQIIKGEVAIVPILRNADGTTKPDTRQTISIDLQPANLALTAYTMQQDIISVRATENADPGNVFLSAENTIGVNYFTGSSNRHSIDYYDQKTLAYIKTDAYGVANNADWNDVTYWPGVGLVMLSYAGFVNRIKLLGGLDPANDWTTLFNPTPSNEGKAASGMAYDWKNGYLLVLNTGGQPSDNQFYEAYDRNFNLVYTRSASRSWNGITVNTTTNDIIMSLSSDLLVLDNATGATIKNLDYTLASFVYFDTNLVVLGDTVYFANSRQDNIRAFALEDFTTKPTFDAVRPGCELKNTILKTRELPQITADITANELLAGVVLSGQLIKAALEYYYQRKAPDDYLDHVYHLDYSSDQNGVPVKAINTGNETFKRAEVVDDFSTLLPGQIVITLDNELTLGGVL